MTADKTVTVSSAMMVGHSWRRCQVYATPTMILEMASGCAIAS
jgi:hypothetical protein